MARSYLWGVRKEECMGVWCEREDVYVCGMVYVVKSCVCVVCSMICVWLDGRDIYVLYVLWYGVYT